MEPVSSFNNNTFLSSMRSSHNQITPVQPATGQNAPGSIDLSHYKTEKLKRDINKKHGQLWTCLDRRVNPSGGKIYTFKFDAKDNFEKIMTDVFPATELPPEMIQENLTGPNVDEKQKEIWANLQKLGYAYRVVDGTTYMEFPDRTALLGNWNELRKENPDLPPISIVSSKGIASDMDFVQAYLSYDILLSDGQEFIHDHLNHVVTVLRLILILGPQYKEEQLLRRNLIKGFYNAIQYGKSMIEGNKPNSFTAEQSDFFRKYLKAYEKALGATTDYIYGESNSIKDEIDHYKAFFYLRVWFMPYWADFMAQSNPDLPTRPEAGMLAAIWSKIDKGTQKSHI